MTAAAGPLILLVGALIPDQRVTGAVAIAIGWIVLRLIRRPGAIAWAAALTVAVTLTWPLLAGPDVPVGAQACVDPFSEIVVRRLGLAVVGLALVAALAVAHRTDLAELGLRRPSRAGVLPGLAGCAALAVGGLYLGPLVARPFFGVLSFPVPLAALVPAVLFGVANGVLEEVQYRGAMQGWLGRVAPRWVAIGFPALVFGVVHAGPEVVALLPLHIALLAAFGAAGGLVRERTGSLVIPIGIHVGADIALYVGLACRAAAG